MGVAPYICDMNFKKLLQDIKPHALVLLAFFLVGYVYYLRTFNGYSHKEDDVTQGLLKGTEIVKYTNKDGSFPGWTNAIFSGMPSTLIKGKVSGNEMKSINYLTPFSHTSYPFQILFLSFIGFYLLLSAFKVKPLYAALGAIAYGFATYSISSVEAAHYTKVLAMAMMPAVLASFHWLFQGEYLKGGSTLAFNMAIQVYYFHYQITFYTLICLLVMGIYYVIDLSKKGLIKQALIATLISVVAVGAGALTNIAKIQSTAQFADNTMRGGNDMVKADASKDSKETGKNGLKRDYAFDWSYGKGETFTLLIPNFYGGSSNEKLGRDSKFYEATQNDEALDQGLPMYHGDLAFTSGPIYVGAIIVFLFVLGMFVVKQPIKWALLALTLVSFILGWGKHFAVVNNFLFDHLPYFNKFRTPMMGFCIAQVSMPLVGFLGLQTLYNNWLQQSVKGKVQASADDAVMWKHITWAFYAVGGFTLLMALMGPSFVDMGGVVDEQLKEGGNNNLISVLKEDRGSMLQKDAMRSFIFIALSFGLLWAWFKQKVSKQIAIACIGILAAVDLIGVDVRYLNWSDFTFQKGTVTDRAPDQADLQIMADKDLHYRVFDLTNDPFNDNEGAAFHKMIGGYDPAKLSRYQDIIAEVLVKEDTRDKGLDMLNCKYMIGLDSGNRRGVIPRFTANGNAWFVSQVKASANAAEEMKALRASNPKVEATYNAEFAQNANLKPQTFVLDSAASAKLMTYHPDTMRYEVNNANPGYLVFSEIWYDNWKASIDGKPVDVNKVDYTLRGIQVPAGQHKIELVFDKGLANITHLEQYLSWAILLSMLLLMGFWLKGYKSEQA